MFLLHDENRVTVCLLKKNHDLTVSEGADGITKGIITIWLTDASQTAPCIPALDRVSQKISTG